MRPAILSVLLLVVGPAVARAGGTGHPEILRFHDPYPPVPPSRALQKKVRQDALLSTLLRRPRAHAVGSEVTERDVYGVDHKVDYVFRVEAKGKLSPVREIRHTRTDAGNAYDSTRDYTNRKRTVVETSPRGRVISHSQTSF
jgi:hypothetical protein